MPLTVCMRQLQGLKATRTNGETVSVALIKSSQYKTSMDGAVVYFNAVHDLQIVLDKIKANGGKIIVPKNGLRFSNWAFMQCLRIRRETVGTTF